MTKDSPDHWRPRTRFDIPKAAPFRVWNKTTETEFRVVAYLSGGPCDVIYEDVVANPNRYTHWRLAAVGPGHRHGAK